MLNAEKFHFDRTLPVSAGWDMVIAGAGPAGCSAALTAGRAGFKVLLLEASTQAW